MLGEGRWKPTEQQREKPEPITLRLGQGQGPSQDLQLLKRGKHPTLAHQQVECQVAQQLGAALFLAQ